MFANPNRIQFGPRMPAGAALADVAAMRFNVGTVARCGAMVRPLTGRPVLACRWVAVAGGRLECRWTIELGGGTSIEGPEGRWQSRRIGLSLDARQSQYRRAVPAIG